MKTVESEAGAGSPRWASVRMAVEGRGHLHPPTPAVIKALLQSASSFSLSLASLQASLLVSHKSFYSYVNHKTQLLLFFCSFDTSYTVVKKIGLPIKGTM